MLQWSKCLLHGRNAKAFGVRKHKDVCLKARNFYSLHISENELFISLLTRLQRKEFKSVQRRTGHL